MRWIDKFVVEKDGEHSGIIYDAWKKVKEKMPEYTFIETFFPTSKNNLEFITFKYTCYKHRDINLQNYLL